MAYANRFAARYRFANSVTLTLKGYTSDTNAGYSSLGRLAFTYSAFETLLELIGCKRKEAFNILDPYPTGAWIKEVRARDPNSSFFLFVDKRVDAKYEKQHVMQYLRGQGCDITALAASVRHIFLHGELTPGAAGAEVTCGVCDHLSDALVTIMDGEFAGRLEPFKDVPPPASLILADDIPF